jgi:hypothetical protein
VAHGLVVYCTRVVLASDQCVSYVCGVTICVCTQYCTCIWYVLFTIIYYKPSKSCLIFKVIIENGKYCVSNIYTNKPAHKTQFHTAPHFIDIFKCIKGSNFNGKTIIKYLSFIVC